MMLRLFFRITAGFLILLRIATAVWAQNISTVAGNGSENVPAISAQISTPNSVAVDANGNLYIADRSNNRIRKVTPEGIVTTVAGTGIAGYSGDGGPATSAQLFYPFGVAVDWGGNLYIADTYNSRIRKVTPDGIITTVAGSSISGYGGDGNLATLARLNQPYGVAVDGLGNIYIADTGNHRLRRVNTSGLIHTIVGNGTAGDNTGGGVPGMTQLNGPQGVALDGSGNIYIADTGNHRVRKVQNSFSSIINLAGTGTLGYSGDGGPAASAHLYRPTGVTADANGNVYIADSNNQRIRKVNTGFVITTVAGTGMAGYSGDNGNATSAQLNLPSGVALDSNGSFYIADQTNSRIRKVNAMGTITTVAGTGINGSGGYSGDGGPAIAAQLYSPFSAALDGSGNLYIADSGNSRVRKVSSSGVITTIAGTGSFGFSGDGGLATAAQLNGVYGTTVDGSGNLYIADANNHRIRKVSTTGVITTVAGAGSVGYNGDGILATSAQLNYPSSVAVDGAGTLYIADRFNHRVRKVSTTGIITTVVGTGISGFSGDFGDATSARLSSPYSVAIDGSGNLYIADQYNHRIRMVSSGMITTVAGTGFAGYSGDGGVATSAQLNLPYGIALDGGNNLYITDRNNQRIRKVNSAGIITTVAGTGTAGFTGDGGAATSAQLNSPFGIAVDGTGAIYITDTNNNRIRKVDGSSCSNMYTLKAGSWSDVSVWSCGRLPVVTDVVTINHVVNLPASYVGQAQRVICSGSGGLLLNASGRLKLAVN
ncbi:NHL repeat-containing protein [Spirosoma daeguense]